MAFRPEIPTMIPIDKVGDYILDSAYGFQEKYNGKRRTIIKSGNRVIALNKTGVERAVDPIFVKSLLALQFENITFEAEQVRNHYHVFDLLTLGNKSFISNAYSKRITKAREILPQAGWLSVVGTATTQEQKMSLATRLIQEKAEGLIIRKLAAHYKQGQSGQHFKIKFEKTLDAVVIGPSPKGHDSVEIGLFDAHGKLVRIGGCSQVGKEKVRAGEIIEVCYLYATGSNHVVQPRMTVKRDDKEAKDCLLSQLVINRDMQ